MCSRYELNGILELVIAAFDLPGGTHFTNQEEIRPTDSAPVVLAGRQTGIMNWGLTASWSKKPLINARSESLSERETFKPLLQNRCVVPASAYFEWRALGRKRHKMRIARTDGGLLAFAGLVKDGCFTIITCPPSQCIAHIHDRMPVILDGASAGIWLGEEKDFSRLAPLLAPYSEAELEANDAGPPDTQGDLFV